MIKLKHFRGVKKTMMMLTKEEYTFAEIAGLLRISKDSVHGDFKRKRFTAVKKSRAYAHGLNGFRFKAKRPTWVVSKQSLIKYLKYRKINDLIR